MYTLFPFTTLCRSRLQESCIMYGLDKCSIVLEQRPVRLVTHCRQRRIGLGSSSKRLPDLHFFTPIFVEGNELIGELADRAADVGIERSEEHTSELQSLMRISYAVFCLKKKIS